MPEVRYTRTELSGGGKPAPIKVEWLGVTNADTYELWRFGKVAQDISIEVWGVPGDAVTTFTVKNNIESVGINAQDIEGDEISITDDAMVSILERPLYLQPRSIGGTGSQALNITMIIWP